jgi:hypothetical protein
MIARLAILLITAGVAAQAPASPCVGPDDTPDLPFSAHPLVVGSPLTRQFERAHDRDLFYFTALPGHGYTVTLTPITGAGLGAVEVRVFQPDGRTLIRRASSTGGRTSARATLAAAPYARRLVIDARPFAEWGQGGYTLSTSAALPPDSDGDGLPNDWEVASGLDPADPGLTPPHTHGPLGDLDGDGLTNYDEWMAGTHPGQSGSALRITLLTVDRQRQRRVQWPAQPHTRYRVLRQAEAGTWSVLGDYLHGPSAGTATFVDPDPLPTSQRHYRIELPY